jgi:hypothetical protein
VFHPMDTSNLLIEIGYLLFFIIEMDTLDVLVSIEYSL